MAGSGCFIFRRVCVTYCLPILLEPLLVVSGNLTGLADCVVVPEQRRFMCDAVGGSSTL